MDGARAPGWPATWQANLSTKTTRKEVVQMRFVRRTQRLGHRALLVPLCRCHHRAYDREELDLLPYLKPA